MAEATTLVTGVPAALWVPVYTIGIVVLLLWTSYRTIARVFKWLTLVLLAYVATAFVAHVDWTAALRATLIPRVEWSRNFFAVLEGVFGTTISPYLFFWQTNQEVEEKLSRGCRRLGQCRGEPHAAGLAVEYLFKAAAIVPTKRPLEVVEPAFHWNYTTFLNIVFFLVAGALVSLTLRRGTRDPVCGMRVDRHTGKPSLVHEGRTYFFCGDGCKAKFEDDPEQYLSPVDGRPLALEHAGHGQHR